MIPIQKVRDLISRHQNLEKELSSGSIDKKNFAEKSKEYSDLNEIVKEAKEYVVFEKNKNEFKSSLDLKSLKEKKIINKKYLKLKILGTGELKTKIDITAHFASKQAQEKIIKAGGKLNIIKK